MPLTGPFSPLGIGDKAAIEQEVKRINADGGVLGRDLEVTIKDDKTDVPQSVTEYNQLAADRSYTAILSSSNVAASTAIGPSAETNKIPTIALGPVSAFKDGSNDYAFTCVAIPELYAEAMVDYLAAEGIESLAIAYTSEDPYGKNGNDATVAAAEAAGIDVVVDEAIDVAATDFTAAISKVKAAKPDAFLVWVAGPASVIITKQFAGSGIPLLMTGAQASNLYVEPAGRRGRGRRDDQQHRRARDGSCRPARSRTPSTRSPTRGWSRTTSTRRSSRSTAPPASSCWWPRSRRRSPLTGRRCATPWSRSTCSRPSAGSSSPRTTTAASARTPSRSSRSRAGS